MAMWGRKDDESQAQVPGQSSGSVAPAETTVATPHATPAPGRSEAARSEAGRKAILGPSIQVKGELIGSEDLVIEGKVEGTVRLRDHQLTIGRSAQVQATLEAKMIRIEGTVHGDVQAGDRVELAPGSTLVGDITAPRMLIADGARFKGSVDMDHSVRPATGAATTERPAYAAPAASGESSRRTPANS